MLLPPLLAALQTTAAALQAAALVRVAGSRQDDMKRTQYREE